MDELPELELLALELLELELVDEVPLVPVVLVEVEAQPVGGGTQWLTEVSHQ